MTEEDILDEVISQIKINTKKPEKFLSTQDDIADSIRQTTKLLYDFTKKEFDEKNNALPELVIQGFDDEQIWQQLELQNEEILANCVAEISSFLTGVQNLALPLSLTEPEDTEEFGDGEEDELSTQDDAELRELTDSEDEEDLNIDLDGNLKKNQVKPRKSLKKSSVVDDEFFKLEELDEFLVKEDKKAMKDHEDNLEDSADEESVDLFENQSDEDDEDAEDRMCRYKDFFDYPHDFRDEQRSGDVEMNENSGSEEASDSESRKRKLSSPRGKEKRVKFDLGSDSDGEADENVASDHEDRDDEQKSSLEKRQERLQMRMRDLEEQAISEKPWQLRGEVSASNRPQNSLLEEFVEFDAASRPAPEVTEEMTMTLEETIRQRIKDKAWDDVVKKFKPVVAPQEYKKKLVMDQEKSTKSLAEVYEQDFLKQRDALNPDQGARQEEEPEAQKEIRSLMHNLFRKLEALSNFHYTPKPAQPEIKIISNIPAITMEEVAPVSTTDATLLAPEEVKGKRRGEIIGKSERTKTDMKRERRKKKIFQKEKIKKDEKKKASLAEKLTANSRRKKDKSESIMIIDKLLKNRNITKIDEKGGKNEKFSVTALDGIKLKL